MLIDVAQFGLTEEDFNDIIKALEKFGDADGFGEAVGEFFEDVLLSKLPPEAAAKVKRKADEMSKKRKLEREILSENMKMLQAKVIKLKRAAFTQ